MKTLTISILLFICVTAFSFLPGEVVNPDKPLNGEWDFKLKKIWEVEKVGDEVFARLTGLLVREDPKDPDAGRLYIRDSQKNKTHIFTTGGKYLSSFAPKGEGPGEVKIHMNVYLAGDGLAVAGFDRLHFFKGDGTFIKSVSNMFLRRRPVFFINPDEFVASPVNVFQRADRKGVIRRVNLQTGKDSVITEFRVFQGGDLRGKSGERRPARLVVIIGLSPLMAVARGGDDRLYYGVSNEYKIHVSNLEGSALSGFSVKRKNKDLTRKQKKELFAGFRNMEEDARARLVESFPDEPTYFYHIEEIGGLVYVFVPDPLSRFPGHRNPKQIDIFSLDGKYQYSAHLEFDGDRGPFSTGTLVLGEGVLYVVLEDEEGDIALTKYHITLPPGIPVK